MWRFRRRSRRPGQRAAYHNRPSPLLAMSATRPAPPPAGTGASSDEQGGVPAVARAWPCRPSGAPSTLTSSHAASVPFFQICAADRLTPTSMAATRNGTPWAINSTNRCRANDFGRLPGPPGYDEWTTSTSKHGFTLHRSLETSPPPLYSPRDHPLSMFRLSSRWIWRFPIPGASPQSGSSPCLPDNRWWAGRAV